MERLNQICLNRVKAINLLPGEKDWTILCNLSSKNYQTARQLHDLTSYGVPKVEAILSRLIAMNIVEKKANKDWGISKKIGYRITPQGKAFLQTFKEKY